MATQQNAENAKEPTTILQLNCACFERALDFLSLQDVIAAGKTCTHLQEFTRDYFGSTFRSSKVIITTKGFETKGHCGLCPP